MGCRGVRVAEAAKLRDTLTDALRAATPVVVEVEIA
ncbi:benzoylformate decarboxylase [Burkholderia cenocepacia]|nr:benzoylformate decarboxylase [Burkholderia cenocepacia]